MTAGDPSGLCRSLGNTSARTYIPGSRTPLPGPCTVSEHSSELLGCPISRSLATSCVGLELRLLPSTGITRLHRYYGPLRHPNAPGLSLTGVRLIIPDHALGFPCCVRFPCVHAAAATPVQRSSHPAVSAFPEGSVGLHIVLFEVCSAFTRVATCTLARSPYFVTRYPKASDISSPPCLLRLLPAEAVAGWDLHPLESAAFSRRTPESDIHYAPRNGRAVFTPTPSGAASLAAFQNLTRRRGSRSSDQPERRAALCAH